MMSAEEARSLICHVLLLFSTTLAKVSGGTVDWNQNITSHLCPYTDFCHTKASKVFTYPTHDYEPCCNQCSCNDNCLETNSCCPDKTIVSDNPTLLVCKSTMVKKRGGYKDNRFYNGLVGGIKSYLITDRCPAGEQDIDIQHRCLGMKRITLDDYLWVSDSATGKIFNNHHCAQCHGIENWKTWNIRTQCHIDIDSRFENLTATLLSDECNIINEIPGEHAAEADKYKCYTPAISVCNQTGLWKRYDGDVDEACKKNTVPFFQIDGLNVVIYKNLFCYVCNAGDASSADMVCPSMNTDARFTGSSFNALIDFVGRKEDKETSSVCAVDQIHDKYMGICRKLVCPFGSRPSAGQCKPLTVTMNNLGVYIILNLRIDWERTKLPDRGKIDTFSMADGEDIAKAIFKALNVKACTVCSMYLKVSNTTISPHSLPDLDFVLIVTTNVDCQYDRLHQNIDKAIGRAIKITLKDHGPIFVQLQYEKRPLSMLMQAVYEYLYIKRWVFCMTSVVPKVKFCPGIRLMYSEVQSLQNLRVKRMLVQLFDGLNANNTTTSFVCLADYFKIMAQANTAVHVGLQTFWLALLLALLQI